MSRQAQWEDSANGVCSPHALFFSNLSFFFFSFSVPCSLCPKKPRVSTWSHILSPAAKGLPCPNSLARNSRPVLLVACAISLLTMAESGSQHS